MICVGRRVQPPSWLWTGLGPGSIKGQKVSKRVHDHDIPMDRQKFSLSERLFTLFVIAWNIVATGLTQSFLYFGSPTSDLASGKTYEVHNHGSAYVWAVLGLSGDILSRAGILLCFAWIVWLAQRQRKY